MQYNEALEYLHERLSFKSIRLGLERIRELLRRMDNPQQSYHVVHVGGTNGKGSVCSFLSFLLREHDLRVGTYISPHLWTLKERFTVNGEQVHENLIAEVLEDMISHIEDMGEVGSDTRPSFFEVTTAMAFEIFKRMKVKIAVVEVGLGGRLDATNVVIPDVSIITNVSYDHMNVLGSTLEKIAREKAGIIKDGKPLVTTEVKPHVLKVLENKVREKNSSIYRLRKDFRFKKISVKLNENVFAYEGKKLQMNGAILSMNGVNQFVNASAALAALEILSDTNILTLKNDAILRGLREARWPGRFEIIYHKDNMVILDGAHNPSGAQILKTNLEHYFPGKELTMVFGVVENKDYKRILSFLAAHTSHIIITRPKVYRATNYREVCEYARHLFEERCECLEDPFDAFERALDVRDVEPILVCGSLYLVGNIRHYILTGERRVEYDRIA